MTKQTLKPVDFDRLAPKPEYRLVVTGGCGGIGRRLVEVAIGLGLSVAVVDLPESLDRHPVPDNVITVPFDATDSASILKAFEMLAEIWSGHIDGLVHLPGFMNRKASIEELSIDEIDETLSVNLRAGFITARSALPLMHASSNASFVFAASGLATLVEQTTAPYSAAKAGTIALAKGIAKAHAPKIRANCIAPGAVDTEFLRGGTYRRSGNGEADFSVPGGKAQMLSTIPMGRIGVVDDIVGPILFLLSDKARFMTGQTLYINGGRLMP